MGKKKFDTVTYDLKKGNEIVYRGTTNDTERRESEHCESGKKFDKMVITSRKMTESGAQKKESEMLKTYRNGHSGSNPKYNKSDDG